MSADEDMGRAAGGSGDVPERWVRESALVSASEDVEWRRGVIRTVLETQVQPPWQSRCQRLAELGRLARASPISLSAVMRGDAPCPAADAAASWASEEDDEFTAAATAEMLRACPDISADPATRAEMRSLVAVGRWKSSIEVVEAAMGAWFEAAGHVARVLQLPQPEITALDSLARYAAACAQSAAMQQVSGRSPSVAAVMLRHAALRDPDLAVEVMDQAKTSRGPSLSFHAVPPSVASSPGGCAGRFYSWCDEARSQHEASSKRYYLADALIAVYSIPTSDMSARETAMYKVCTAVFRMDGLQDFMKDELVLFAANHGWTGYFDALYNDGTDSFRSSVFRAAQGALQLDCPDALLFLDSLDDTTEMGDCNPIERAFASMEDDCGMADIVLGRVPNTIRKMPALAKIVQSPTVMVKLMRALHAAITLPFLREEEKACAQAAVTELQSKMDSLPDAPGWIGDALDKACVRYVKKHMSEPGPPAHGKGSSSAAGGAGRP